MGINIWQTEDQSDNLPDAALLNAKLEGVAERVEVQTADMPQLPFPNQSFDAVVSHWAVHNLSNAEERTKALNEIHRVLKPGGHVLLVDIKNMLSMRWVLSRLASPLFGLLAPPRRLLFSPPFLLAVFAQSQWLPASQPNHSQAVIATALEKSLLSLRCESREDELVFGGVGLAIRERDPSASHP